MAAAYAHSGFQEEWNTRKVKRSPVRLALPLLSGALLLTACPGVRPIPIDVPSNPAVLNGTWKGTLQSSIDVRDAAWGEGRVYLLQQELASPAGLPMAYFPFTNPKVRPALVVLDAASGVELRRLDLAGSELHALRFRAAEPGQPARLVLLRSAVLVTGAPASTVLSELDPVTLEETKQTTLPGSLWNYRLNTDGRWLISGSLTVQETRTLQPATLPQTIQDELAKPQEYATRNTSWDYGEQFLRVATRTAGAQHTPWTTRLYSVTTGQAFGGAAQHPLACTKFASDVLTEPTGMVNLPDGGAALAYRDGTVELRGPDDRLRRTIDLGDCLGHTLRVDGDVLTFAVVEENELQLGTLRMTDGQVLSRRRAATTYPIQYPPLEAEGTALMARPRWRVGIPLVELQRTSGAGWLLEKETHTLHLDTRATWTSKAEYSSVGEAWLDGERLNFAATVRSGTMEFRPQATAPVPPSWQGTLSRLDGTVVARVQGTHWNMEAQQAVMLELQGSERDFAFNGLLRP